MLAGFCVLSENEKKTTTDSGDDNKIDFETETAPLKERRKVSVLFWVLTAVTLYQ